MVLRLKVLASRLEGSVGAKLVDAVEYKGRGYMSHSENSSYPLNIFCVGVPFRLTYTIPVKELKLWLICFSRGYFSKFIAVI